MADERRADVAFAGQQRDHRRRHTAGTERLQQSLRAAGRLLGRLQHDGVAGRERGGRHPARDRDREVPGGDHGRDAARDVAQLVALAGDLQQRPPGLERDRAPRVVLEEVDRLAHVGVGLGPWLGALPDLDRRELEPALAHPGGGADQRCRALGGRNRTPAAKPIAGHRHRGVDIVLGGARRPRHEPLGLARIGRVQPRTVPYIGADRHRDVQRQHRVRARERVGRAGRAPRRGAARAPARWQRGAASTSP